jgi:hypothetical protein
MWFSCSRAEVCPRGFHFVIARAEREGAAANGSERCGALGTGEVGGERCRARTDNEGAAADEVSVAEP